MIFVLDNYDSFTYNLVQYLAELGAEVQVARNNEVTPADILARRPDGILISPGPGTPAEAGISKELILAAAGRVPLLGVCLGHQALAEVYGGRVVRAARLMHGKTSPIHHDGQDLFRGLPDPFTATRYHSLIVAPEDLPAVLEVTAWTAEKEIMGLRHREHRLWGVQFHPESILTGSGKALIRNFLEAAGGA
ncbi:MAG: aminodeoxychorismate/anthranilate synthase component II [Candidatus Eisenbacteria bacterium]|nr:aminodeoxychorismate/anthranilate synthase component II [Candidatus Eisenbacteria bacterium]